MARKRTVEWMAGAVHSRRANTSVTNEQIRALRRESAEAGDLDMVAVCDQALVRVTHSGSGTVTRADEMAVDRARRECARVIAAGVQRNPAGPFAFYAPIYRRHRGRGPVIDVGVSVRKAPTFEGILEEIRAWLAVPRSQQGRQERWPDIPAHAVEVFKERAPGYINTEDLVAYVDVADGAIVGVRERGVPKPGESGFARLTRGPVSNPQGVSMDFEYYSEGPDKKDPEIALEVEVKRGMVTAREWQSLAGYSDDPSDQDKFALQAFSMLLGSLLHPEARFRGSYSGDAGWSLADVQRMPKNEREDAIVSAAISRLAYGPNDERVVSRLGDRR